MNTNNSVTGNNLKWKSNTVSIVPLWLEVLFVLYIFLSYFEIYFIGKIGNSTKYLMLFIILSFIIVKRGKLLINVWGLSYLIWFVYWCMSILWSNHSSPSVEMHFISQIGIVLFIFILSGIRFDSAFIRLNLKAHFFVSFLFGALSILLNRPYLDKLSSGRRVLTLFGIQNDPNNCAAFLIVGIAIAMYSIIYESKFKLLSVLVVAVNGFALMLTSSRAGIISIVVILLALLFFRRKRVDKQNVGTITKILIVFCIVVLLCLFGYKYLPQDSLNRILAFENYSNASGRNELWKYTFDLIVERPIFGWGWGGYTLPFNVLTHNTILSLWCEGGIVGLALFLFPIISLLYYSFKRKNVLVIIILLCGLLPSLGIDAINKRFLWNAILVSILIINYQNWFGSCNNFCIWNQDSHQ